MARARTNGQSTEAGAQRTSPRSKRVAILTQAVELFGREGYENSKWADVAGAVGIGSTALYHYFESKLHCLYVIMAEAVEAHRDEFGRITKNPADFEIAMDQALRAGFDLSDFEVLRMRVLVAEQGLVRVPRKSAREESARSLARERMRALEFDWAAFLVRGMENGSLPEADPALLARALLGLNNSVWHWYRPGGAADLGDVTEFFVSRQRLLAGLPADSPAHTRTQT